MKRPVLTICRNCRPRRNFHGSDPATATGDVLLQAVRAVRRARGLKKVFKVEDTGCLKQCRHACALALSGGKRPTYLRRQVDALADIGRVVDAAAAYAELEPGERLEEGVLPGEPGK